MALSSIQVSFVGKYIAIDCFIYVHAVINKGQLEKCFEGIVIEVYLNIQIAFITYPRRFTIPFKFLRPAIHPKPRK